MSEQSERFIGSYDNTPYKSTYIVYFNLLWQTEGHLACKKTSDTYAQTFSWGKWRRKTRGGTC